MAQMDGPDSGPRQPDRDAELQQALDGAKITAASALLLGDYPAVIAVVSDFERTFSAALEKLARSKDLPPAHLATNVAVLGYLRGRAESECGYHTIAELTFHAAWRLLGRTDPGRSSPEIQAMKRLIRAEQLLEAFACRGEHDVQGRAPDVVEPPESVIYESVCAQADALTALKIGLCKALEWDESPNWAIDAIEKRASQLVGSWNLLTHRRLLLALGESHLRSGSQGAAGKHSKALIETWPPQGHNSAQLAFPEVSSAEGIKWQSLIARGELDLGSYLRAWALNLIGTGARNLEPSQCKTALESTFRVLRQIRPELGSALEDLITSRAPNLEQVKHYDGLVNLEIRQGYGYLMRPALQILDAVASAGPTIPESVNIKGLRLARTLTSRALARSELVPDIHGERVAQGFAPTQVLEEARAAYMQGLVPLASKLLVPVVLMAKFDMADRMSPAEEFAEIECVYLLAQCELRLGNPLDSALLYQDTAYYLGRAAGILSSSNPEKARLLRLLTWRCDLECELFVRREVKSGGGEESVTPLGDLLGVIEAEKKSGDGKFALEVALLEQLHAKLIHGERAPTPSIEFPPGAAQTVAGLYGLGADRNQLAIERGESDALTAALGGGECVSRAVLSLVQSRGSPALGLCSDYSEQSDTLYKALLTHQAQTFLRNIIESESLAVKQRLEFMPTLYGQAERALIFSHHALLELKSAAYLTSFLIGESTLHGSAIELDARPRMLRRARLELQQQGYDQYITIIEYALADMIWLQMAGAQFAGENQTKFERWCEKAQMLLPIWGFEEGD